MTRTHSRANLKYGQDHEGEDERLGTLSSIMMSGRGRECVVVGLERFHELLRIRRSICCNRSSKIHPHRGVSIISFDPMSIENQKKDEDD